MERPRSRAGLYYEAGHSIRQLNANRAVVARTVLSHGTSGDHLCLVLRVMDGPGTRDFPQPRARHEPWGDEDVV